MNNTLPYCSVIVLNYFGEKVIKNTVESLLSLHYPKEYLEIIIIDNNSTDKSREIISSYAEKYSYIKYLFLSKNLGFAGGNNVGLRIAKGEYVALLNNDCIVEQNWLNELVKTSQKDSKIFAVSSKIKLYPKYYYLEFNYNDALFLSRINIANSKLSKLVEKNNLYLDIINKNKSYFVEIPYAPDDRLITVDFTFDFEQQDLLKSCENIFNVLTTEGKEGISKKIIREKKLSIKINFDVRKFSKKSIYEKIQNAGIVVFQDGSGRDIGVKIYEQRQYYEYDFGQYSTEQEVYAACGAAVLYNKKILDKIGLLDESFFMYYEDVEICERARLQGYKIYYSPKAEVRHLHAFSSKEWSNFFIYQAEKGRLLHIFFSFPLHIFIKEYLVIILRIGDVALRILKGISDHHRVLKFIRNIISYFHKTPEKEGSGKTDFGRAVQFVKILFYFFFNSPILLIKKYMKYKNVSRKAITNNYNKILKGRWYFN